MTCPRGAGWRDIKFADRARQARARRIAEAGPEPTIRHDFPQSLFGHPVRTVDAETQALIAAAEAAGRVTVCPPAGVAPDPQQGFKQRARTA